MLLLSLMSCSQAPGKGTELLAKAELAPIDSPKNADKNLAANAEQTNEQKSFENFCQMFPILRLPFAASERQTMEFRIGANPYLSEESVEQYICNQPNSTLTCSEAPGESVASDDSGFDIRGHFLPVGQSVAEQYIILIYHLSYLGYHENFLATYTKQGKLISRIRFSGYNGDFAARYGKLLPDLSIKTELQQLADDKKTANPKIVKTTHKLYAVESNGSIVEKTAGGQSIKDEAGQ